MIGLGDSNDFIQPPVLNQAEQIDHLLSRPQESTINQEIVISQEDSKREDPSDHLISLNTQFNAIGLGLASQENHSELTEHGSQDD